MGSVAHLYTSGDNDAEIVPVQYYRHYLYCDACGSFELESWRAPDDRATPDSQALAKRRQRLGKAALFSALLALVAGWLAVGLAPSPAVLVLLPAGVSLALVGQGFILRTLWGSSEPLAARWRFFKSTLPWLVAVALAQWLASEFYLPSWILVVTGVTLSVGLLIWRQALGSQAASRAAQRSLGTRCSQCGATYANNSAFFTDFDANPRNLTLAEAPRPLGSSTFLQGKPVDRFDRRSSFRSR